jgi:hypothetical protein
VITTDAEPFLNNQFPTASTYHAETTPIRSDWCSKPEVTHKSSQRPGQLCFYGLLVCLKLQLLRWRQTTRMFNDLRNVYSTEYFPCRDVTFSVYEEELTVGRTCLVQLTQDMTQYLNFVRAVTNHSVILRE